MTVRSIDKFIKAMAMSEGAGVTVHRTIGTPALRNLDPFLMLDHFSSDDPDDYIAGFPNHPHRGFITFTYMLDGNMLHGDSMGNQGNLSAGGAQWMKAASGIIHSEMPRQEEGLMRGFQLWINLPAKEKMSSPEYQEFTPDAIPVVQKEGEWVRVLIGHYQDVQGPVQDPLTDVLYLDVTLDSDHLFETEISSKLQSFMYVFEGEGEIEGNKLPQHSFVVLGQGDKLKVKAGKTGMRFILGAGKPIGEPIVQYGPFVMNSEDEIQQAMIDYQKGVLVQEKASFITN